MYPKDKFNEKLAATPEEGQQENDGWASLDGLEMTPPDPPTPPEEGKNPEAAIKNAGPNVDQMGVDEHYSTNEDDSREQRP